MKRLKEIEVKKLIKTLEEGTNIIEMSTPINIKDKQPDIGQRCNVYDGLLQKWVYATYYPSQGTNFIKWNYDSSKRFIKVKYWLPELDKPGKKKIE